jgi:hypothetical protein
MTETTSEAELGAEDSKDHIVNGIDNCKPRTDRTDKELGFLDNILDFTDCYKDCYKDSDFTGHTVNLIDCTKLTDV